MKDLVKIDTLPAIPEDWDYETSVAYLKPKIEHWKQETIEIATELYTAKQVLYAPGRRTDLLQDCSRLPTFKEYCSDVCIPERTAFYWISSVFGPQRLPSPTLPKLESQVLYADPPWAFDNSGFDQSAEKKYPVLKPELIENYTDETGRQIRQLAKQKESVLFLWVPEAILPEGLKVLQGWGFTYKAQMVWKKDRAPGMGWWVKSKHEQLFIGTRGTELHPATKYDSVFEAPVTQHSKKPEIVYEMIEQMYTGPYIELFARNTRLGWVSWGNEVKGTMKARREITKYLY